MQRRNGDADFTRLFGSNFVIITTHSHGSCFFHTLASALVKGYFNKSKGAQFQLGLKLRRSFADVCNEALYKRVATSFRDKLKRKGFDDMIDDALTPPYYKFRASFLDARTWADMAMISCVANEHNLNVLFFDNKTGTFSPFFERFEEARRKSMRTILVHWKNHKHFELICEQSSDNHITTQFSHRTHPELMRKIESEFRR